MKATLLYLLGSAILLAAGITTAIQSSGQWWQIATIVLTLVAAGALLTRAATPTEPSEATPRA